MKYTKERVWNNCELVLPLHGSTVLHDLSDVCKVSSVRTSSVFYPDFAFILKTFTRHMNMFPKTQDLSQTVATVVNRLIGMTTPALASKSKQHMLYILSYNCILYLIIIIG